MRIRLMQVQGLSRKAVEAVLAERGRSERFKGFQDFFGGVSVDPCDEQTVLRQELETMGALVPCHPLPLQRLVVARLWPVRSVVGRHILVVDWWVTAKTVHAKDDWPLEFVSSKDTVAIFDLTFVSRAYERFYQKS
jgi:DNA polymerase III alpha subunit